MSDNTMTSKSDPASPETDRVLAVKNIDVQFKMDKGTSHVIRDVSVDVYRGETFGIVGESGSGKSMFADSLLNAVVEPGQLTGEITYYPPDGEPIDILGLDSYELNDLRWEHISMVFQGAMSAFNPTLTIGGHFEETLRAHDRDKETGMEYARELLVDLHLDPERTLHSYPHQLSGGQKQRALLALSLLLDPEVLVLDEPTAALDLLMQRSIINLLYDIKDKYDLTLLFISHDLPIVSGFADRLGVMYAFEFIEIGPANKILGNPAHPYTRALLMSTPNLEIPLEDMQEIEGESPDPVSNPLGCSYHPRCPLAEELCTVDEPPLLDVSDEHVSACFFWEEVEEITSFGDPGDSE